MIWLSYWCNIDNHLGLILVFGVSLFFEQSIARAYQTLKVLADTNNKHRLVDEVIVVSPFLFEVCDALGKKLNFIHNMLVVRYETMHQCCMTER